MINFILGVSLTFNILIILLIYIYFKFVDFDFKKNSSIKNEFYEEKFSNKDFEK